MTTLDVLKAARELISDPARWTQGFFARDGAGMPAYASDPRATRWCLEGALIKFCLGDASYAAALMVLRREQPVPQLPAYVYNDDHTHAEVLALFDAAIARLESEARYA